MSIGDTGLTLTLVAFVQGNSPAMKSAWIEDMLSTVPQIAFVVAVRFIRRDSTVRHTYGFHRSMNIRHLVGTVALLVVGAAGVRGCRRALPRSAPIHRNHAYPGPPFVGAG